MAKGTYGFSFVFLRSSFFFIFFKFFFTSLKRVTPSIPLRGVEGHFFYFFLFTT